MVSSKIVLAEVGIWSWSSELAASFVFLWWCFFFFLGFWGVSLLDASVLLASNAPPSFDSVWPNFFFFSDCCFRLCFASVARLHKPRLPWRLAFSNNSSSHETLKHSFMHISHQKLQARKRLKCALKSCVCREKKRKKKKVFDVCQEKCRERKKKP